VEAAMTKQLVGFFVIEVEYFQLPVVITLDAIWCANNNRIHNNVTPNLQSLLIQIQSSIAIHQKAWSDKDLIASWSPLSIGYLKLNFDVVVRNNYMVAAVVISDHDGFLLWAVSRKLPLLDINAGEARAALLAVEAAKFYCPSSNIILEGDSLVTILALNNPCYCAEWSSSGIIVDVISVLSFLFFLVCDQSFLGVSIFGHI
jgi:hypothetical protein